VHLRKNDVITAINNTALGMLNGTIVHGPILELYILCLIGYSSIIIGSQNCC